MQKPGAQWKEDGSTMLTMVQSDVDLRTWLFLIFEQVFSDTSDYKKSQPDQFKTSPKEMKIYTEKVWAYLDFESERLPTRKAVQQVISPKSKGKKARSLH